MFTMLIPIALAGRAIHPLGAMPPPWTMSDICSIAALRPIHPEQTIGFIDDPTGKDNSKPIPNDITASAEAMTDWPRLPVRFIGKTMKTEFGKCSDGPDRLKKATDIHLSPTGRVAWMDLGTSSYYHGRFSGADAISCMFEKRGYDWVSRGCVEFGMILT